MEGCHSPDQPNVTSYDVTVLAIVTLEVFAGIWINAFMVSLLCVAWIKKKSLDSNAKILLLLGFFRLWYFFFSWLYSILLIIYPHFLYVQPTYALIISIMSFFESSYLWVSACLCGFYCVKIANFRNSFFIYLKVKINRIVPRLLVGSVLLALAVGIIVYSIADKELCNNSTAQGNFSKISMHKDDGFFYIYSIVGFGFVTSFMAVIFSALLLLFSLWRHRHNMQTNSMKDLSVGAHIKAMKSILSFLVMYSINFVCLIATLISSMKEKNPIMLLIYMFQYVFPVVHSLLLIFSNPKLEKTLLSFLPCLKCRVCMR